MPNSFDLDPRGPSNGRLVVAGVVLLLVTGVVVALMIGKYKGKLDPIVRVSAELVNVGDGLPVKSDVKFRGVLVGFVAEVVPAGAGEVNIVSIDLKPEFAAGIPNTVTARVVPSNVFAVSSVQLVDAVRSSAPLQAGAVIPEDQTLPTVLFQTTLSKIREVLAAVGRSPSGDSVGVLAAVGEATAGRGDRLRDAGRDLNEIVAELNTVVSDGVGPSTISAFADAADGLRDAAPDLFDALGSAVRPMQTLADKRSALTNFLAAGLGTSAGLADAFDHQADRLITITTELTPVMGALADNADKLHSIPVSLQRVANAFYDEAWDSARNVLRAKVVVSLTPTRTYVRADCPRYGEVAGPSCFTAPEVPVAPALTPALNSRGFPLPPGVSENRPNLAPPRGSVLPPAAPVLPPAAPAVPPQNTPPELPSAGAEPLLPAEAAPTPGAPAGGQPQSAVIGGNVGSVGSSQEVDQLSLIVGGRANAATQLLLGPVARGATVHLAPDTGGGP